ncbi:MAG: malonic semialdehyde reductase [Actinomycetota bacterium]|nr:malonic semialdehyde reductase [Actinomycetota bacterium]
MSAILASQSHVLSQHSSDLLFRAAHTAYDFTSESVSDAELAEIYALVRYAPTALNSQPLRISYVRSEIAKSRLMPHLAEMNRPKATSAPVVAILAADLDFHEHLELLLPQKPDAKAQFADAEKRATTAALNAHLQAGYFMLAARAIGLDVGPMGGFDAAGVDAEFFGGTAHRSFLIVNLGHVSERGTFPRNPRLEHHQAVTTL